MRKTLYLDCSMGAAGDMLAAALLELFPHQEGLIRELNELGLPGVTIERKNAVKCGITGSHFQVKVKGQEEESVDAHEFGHQHGQDGHSHVHLHDHSTCGHTHEHLHDHSTYSHTHEYTHDHSHDSSPHEPHSHTSLHRIEHLVKDHLCLPDKVKRDILAVYTLIAQAESKAHGVPVEEIHFHEVGTMDALADITAVCLLMDKLSPDQVIVSPIHVGSGQVSCAHGILPVPAPATAHILQEVPIYGGKIKGELCTPTGAALLKHFAARFGDMPVMRTKAIGYGMGKKDFGAANCIRAMWGEAVSQEAEEKKALRQAEDKSDCRDEENACQDTVWELSCNVDDMTAEEIGFALEEFLAAGAVEAYTIPIGMKKSRPGSDICVLCKEEKRDSMVQAIFKHTSTLGIRQKQMRRYVLERKILEEETPLGRLHYKQAEGYGVERKKYEYEELAALARKHNMSLREVRKKLFSVCPF